MVTRELIKKTKQNTRALLLRAPVLALCLMDGELVHTWKEGPWVQKNSQVLGSNPAAAAAPWASQSAFLGLIPLGSWGLCQV